jgi:hypothetical protein
MDRSEFTNLMHLRFKFVVFLPVSKSSFHDTIASLLIFDQFDVR